MDEWNGEVPLLGFNREYHAGHNKTLLRVPVSVSMAPIQEVEVFAWSHHHNSPHGEGYNLFMPGEPPVALRTPLEVKLVIQDYLNRITHGGNNDE